MKKLLQLALGIMAAVGGFLDIGDLVFASRAGARFGYTLLWALAVGVFAVIVFSEMSGRVSAVAKKPVFVLVREQYSRPLAISAVALSLVLNILTCAAEIGGVALIVRLLTNWSYEVLVFACAAVLIVVVFLMPFEGVERLFGYLGLMLIAFVVSALHAKPDLPDVALGLVPRLPGNDVLLYAYFAVGIMAATLMPYEVYFYSSGAVEEDWGPADLKLNAFTATAGYVLGSLLVVAIIVVSWRVLGPHGIDPQLISSAALGPLSSIGRWGLLFALGGMLFSIAGASIEVAFSSAYTLGQYLGWDWHKPRRPESINRFEIMWIVVFLIAAPLIATGLDPIKLTEYAVLLSVVLMPITYLPILRAANDEKTMGEHVNKPFARTLGWISFGIACVVAVTAIPLMIATRMGG